MRPAGGERTQAAGGGERASAAGVDAAEARWQRGKRRQGGETGTSLVKGVATRVTVDQGTAVRGGPAREPRQARGERGDDWRRGAGGGGRARPGGLADGVTAAPRTPTAPAHALSARVRRLRWGVCQPRGQGVAGPDDGDATYRRGERPDCCGPAGRYTAPALAPALSLTGGSHQGGRRGRRRQSRAQRRQRHGGFSDESSGYGGRDGAAGAAAEEHDRHELYVTTGGRVQKSRERRRDESHGARNAGG